MAERNLFAEITEGFDALAVERQQANQQLRELPHVAQMPGEPRRRWFYCHEIDLVVWERDGAPCGFQLAYDKHRNEHSIAWHADNGYRHFVVDDGEPAPGINRTPLLYADGPFRRDRVLDLFLTYAADLPDDITAFVASKLREFGAD